MTSKDESTKDLKQLFVDLTKQRNQMLQSTEKKYTEAVNIFFNFNGPNLRKNKIKENKARNVKNNYFNNNTRF